MIGCGVADLVKLTRREWIAAPALVLAGSCSRPGADRKETAPQMMKTDRKPFGRTASGQEVELFTLRSPRGLVVSITNYGGIVTSIMAPDKSGVTADVALGFSSLDAYLKPNPYFGAIVGRYGNRIAKAKFVLNGKTYTLAANNGPNSLHGGTAGFDKKVWQAKVRNDGGLELTMTSPDGDEGYPGALTTQVVYTVTPENELRIEYSLTSDKDTVANVTNHSYFHLDGEGSGTILDHVLQIDADEFTPVDATLIPTGQLMTVDGTPFDFRTPHAIGERIENPHEQIRYGGGYDHNFVIRGAPGTLRRAARVKAPRGGRVMEVWTSEPGMQFYTGNFLDGTLTGKAGVSYGKRFGFCMETQHFPDSPNQPSFPTTLIRAGETRQSTTTYRFSAE